MATDPPITPEPRPEWGPPQHKTLTWFDAHVTSELIKDIPGEEFLQGIIDGRFPPPPISMTSASRLTHIAPGEATFRCIPDPSFLNPLGLVHGGLLCMLLDSAMGVAVQTTQPAGVGYASIELKVSFLKPLPYDGRELEVRGRALQTGRRIAFAEGHAYDADGTLLGHSTSSLARVERRSC